MRKLFVIIAFLLLSGIASAQYPQVVFSGQDLAEYMDETVVFAQTLYVCGHSGRTLYLSYERMHSPEEVAPVGTAEFTAQQLKCESGFLTAYCYHVFADTVRLGSTITNLQAYVTDSQDITIYGNLDFDNLQPPTSRPEVGNARLLLCASNLQYYCPIWQNTYGAGSDEEFRVQNLKILKGLSNINADLYALEEVQEGTAGLDSLVNGLNARTASGRYAYIADGNTTTSTYTKVALIYRTDKLAPYLSLGYPYTSSVYRKREYVQAFTELATNERFILSVNHFKAKDGTGSASTNAIRMQNVQRLVDFLTFRLNNNYYNDNDVLIVGDLNCNTHEEPLLYLEDHNYQNQLSIYSPDEYSYVYDNQVSYLDHVFASPSMATQVTGAAPYHLNADASYRQGYCYGDTTMYRYSDHDPIVVGLNLNSNQISIQNNENIDNEVVVYAIGKNILIHSAETIDVTVYDLLGRTIVFRSQLQQGYIPMLTAGLYLVRAGNHVKKVVVE
ncbi:MAG: hypothetical protein J5644_11335 [Bacteroidales bacterium]|nr:hypothetical protein [Bacteroidales bacterium]